MSLESLSNFSSSSSPFNEVQTSDQPIVKPENLKPTGKPTSGASSGTTFDGSLSSLRELSPEFEEALIEGLAQKICKEAKDHVRKLKEMRLEDERIRKESS